jgi:threonine/homoserine/homoserine lactone efflux protein
MLDFSQLLPFSLASLIIILSPGADSFVLLRISHSRGVKDGMSALWGINLGNTTQALLMISGIGLVVSKIDVAILVLKVLGGIYMSYLAIMAARAALKPQLPSPPATADSQSKDTSGNGTRAEGARVKNSSPFMQGLISNITNPKPLLFYLAFFPLFIGKATNVPVQLTVLSSIFIGMALIWQTVIVYAAVKLSETMKSARFNRIMDVICAVAFAAIAALIFSEI